MATKEDLRQQLLAKLSTLLKADATKQLEFASSSGENGVNFTITIPKGSKKLVPHVRELVALVADHAT